MSNNAVNSIFSKVKRQNDDLKSKNELIEIQEEKLDKEIVLANYNFDYEVEEEVIEYLKDVTFEIHKSTHKYYTKLGKIFSETQEKLSNNKNGVFKKWFENVGFKKDFVYENISRYKYIVGLTDNTKIENFENIPVTLSYEISKESCPEAIRERVITGEIKTKTELKKAIREVQQEEPEEIIEEAEIVPKTISYEEIEKVIRNLEKAITDIEVLSLEGNSEDVYEKLKRALEVLR